MVPMESLRSKGVHFGGLNTPDINYPTGGTPTRTKYRILEIDFIHSVRRRNIC